MPSTEGQDSSSPAPFLSPSPFRSFGRSIFSPRREHSQSMEAIHEYNFSDTELESFQKQIVDRLHDLSGASADELISVDWIRKLLDSFIYFQEEFKVILLKNKTQISRPPLDHLVGEYFERSLKALDVCNATRSGIDKVHLWQKHLEIVLCALDSRQRVIGKGQFRRARKALMDLELAMSEEKDSDSVISYRNPPPSFGRNNQSSKNYRHPHHRSLSLTVSPSASAARQIQLMANNLIQPRLNEIMSTNGLALTIYTISSVLMFVLWTLVTAIPNQDKGLNIHLSFPRHLSCGFPLLLLHERIVEETRRRNRPNSNTGSLKEIYKIQKCARQLTELIDLPDDQFPITEEHKNQVEEGVKELALVSDAFKSGLDSLEQQVREVFHRIACFRNDFRI
ncbi:hypothetical protein JCGZ_03524 [Jatropha curcas]|uniref:R3H domain-containing protein n=1 Tax=Jatropha curcas TaxID=180498 RepID=A0A067JPE0_JATCU|nr:uncharacterized protein LOC105648996 [Jatropha curcas]KDP21880.1 hypothetical protein JCGZ_03524 [Jatropha curcas]